MTAPTENIRGLVKFSTPYAEADAGFVQFIDDLADWQEETFGSSTDISGVLAHIRKELVEVKESPDDISEYADLIILTLDAARRRGFLGTEIVNACYKKALINRNRQWPPWQKAKPGRPIEHIKK